jgi:hypothetical protein
MTRSARMGFGQGASTLWRPRTHSEPASVGRARNGPGRQAPPWSIPHTPFPIASFQGASLCRLNAAGRFSRLFALAVVADGAVRRRLCARLRRDGKGGASG